LWAIPGLTAAFGQHVLGLCVHTDARVEGWRMGWAVAIGLVAGLSVGWWAYFREVRFRAPVIAVLAMLLLSGCLSDAAADRYDHCTNMSGGGENTALWCALYAFTGWEWIIGVVVVIFLLVSFLKLREASKQDEEPRAFDDQAQDGNEQSSGERPDGSTPASKQPQPPPTAGAASPDSAGRDPPASSRPTSQATSRERPAPGQPNQTGSRGGPDASASAPKQLHHPPPRRAVPADPRRDPALNRLVVAREAALKAGDFALADDLRKRIRAVGWYVRDTPRGTKLRMAELAPLTDRATEQAAAGTTQWTTCPGCFHDFAVGDVATVSCPYCSFGFRIKW
jgi:hypothetical protein